MVEIRVSIILSERCAEGVFPGSNYDPCRHLVRVSCVLLMKRVCLWFLLRYKVRLYTKKKHNAANTLTKADTRLRRIANLRCRFSASRRTFVSCGVKRSLVFIERADACSRNSALLDYNALSAYFYKKVFSLHANHIFLYGIFFSVAFFTLWYFFASLPPRLAT